MMGRQSGGQKQLFYSFNLDDHVPLDHLLRGVDQFLTWLICTGTSPRSTAILADRRLIPSY
jgi:hypothetical protein